MLQQSVVCIKEQFLSNLDNIIIITQIKSSFYQMYVVSGSYDEKRFWFN